MTPDERLDQWTRDAAAPFAGWDFSYLADRMIEAAPPWDYLVLAKAAVGRAHDIQVKDVETPFFDGSRHLPE